MMYMVLKVFYLFIIWWPSKSRMWMSGVGKLCAFEHYRASVFMVYVVKWLKVVYTIEEDRTNNHLKQTTLKVKTKQIFLSNDEI